MAETPRPEVSRVLVSCDTSPLGSAALDAAVGLARRLDAEIAGLYVEDINLLRMAKLPFAREYGLANAAARRIETVDLERSLRLQADAVRTALSRAAQALSVPWSFQVVRGTLFDSVLKAMRGPDLAVFGWSGPFAVAPGARVAMPAIIAGAPALRQPIATLYDGTPAAERALATAQALAQVHHTSLIMLLLAPDAAAAELLRERVALTLQGSAVRVRFQAVGARDPVAIRSAVERHHAATLLWHGVQTAADRKTLATLVDGLKCPVVLVL